MTITLEPVTLESDCGDDEGMLALRDGRLIAVLTRLSSIHREYSGRWFVETVFASWLPAGEMFPALSDFINRASDLSHAHLEAE